MGKISQMLFAIVAFMAILSLSSASILAADIPEPTRGSDVPADVKWDTELGCYVSSDYYSLKSGFEPSIPKAESNIMKMVKAEINQMIKQSKLTELDKALEQYNQDRVNNPSAEAFYDPHKDNALKIITKLGAQELPAMLDQIQNDREYAGILMYAVQEITSIKGPDYIDAPAKGRQVWLTHLNQLIQDTPKQVHANAAELQKNPNNQAALNQIVELGWFAVPYVIDEAEKGNTVALASMDKIIKSDIPKTNDKVSWLKWGEMHEKELQVLRSLAK